MKVAVNNNLPRMLVIGARGFLGTFFVNRSRNMYEVVRADRTRTSEGTDVVIDIADEASVDAGMEETRPDLVVLLAAISDIDLCERKPEMAIAVNMRGPEHVANACARQDARLLFTSTGAVFDGLKQGYSEEDTPTPLSVYGKTKVQAEGVIAQLVPSAVTVRVSLVLGRTGKQGTNSLMDNLSRRWKAGEAVSASVLESRNPIDAGTMSSWMLELLSDENNHGIFHTGATEAITRYELAKAVAKQMNVPAELVTPEFAPAAGRAPRGAHQLLLTDKINRACKTQAPSCEEVIERSLNEFA